MKYKCNIEIGRRIGIAKYAQKKLSKLLGNMEIPLEIKHH